MTKADLKLLERIFDAEINNRLPFQSKSKRFEQLERDGMVATMSRIIGAGERFPVTVKGWQLTHAGRITYCESCGDPSQKGWPEEERR